MASTRLLIRANTAANTRFWDERLEKDASRLFAENHDEAEIWHFDVNGVATMSVSGISSIATAIQPKQTERKDTFCILRQRHSWSQILITRSAFREILEIRDILPRFTDLIQGFGVKLSEDEKVRVGCSTSLLVGEGCDNDASLMVCYNVQYMTKNERPSSNPWCLRQTAIYHQLDLKRPDSFWLLVQPSKALLEALRAVLTARRHQLYTSQDYPLTLHVIFLEITLSDWSDYIEYLRVEVSNIDDKASFSKLNGQRRHDYMITFQDIQKMQLLQQRLYRALSVLGSQMMIIDRCKCFADGLAASKVPRCSSHSTSSDFETFAAQIDFYRAEIERLLQYSKGTTEILSKILAFRNDEIVLQTDQAVRANLEIMTRMAVQEGQIAEQARKDSMVLKALNMIAIVYLPASLVATIFSSNLIDTQPDITGPGQRFVIARQFWIYVVATVMLTFFTFCCSLVLSRQWVKKMK